MGTRTNMLWKYRVMFAAFLLTSGVAHAQTTDPQAEAESLLDEAVKLMAKNQSARACPKLEKITKLVPHGIGAKLVLGECYERINRLASAWRQYVHAQILATRVGDARANEARFAALRLKPRLAMLKIVMPDSVRSLDEVSVLLDRVEQGPDGWGSEVPVDVGTHELEVNASGRRTWKNEVKINANGEHRTITVSMLEIQLNAFERVFWEPDFPKWRKGAMVVGTGLSLTGIGIGIGFAVATREKHLEAIAATEDIRLKRSVNETVCPVGRLDADCDELRNILQIRDRYRDYMKAGFIGGGIVAAATVAIRLYSGKKVEPNDNRGTFVVVPTLSSISVMGTF